jgi:hypothetical protein
MTPRQLMGALKFAEADARREMGESLAIQAAAARGEPGKVKALQRELSSDRPV